MDEIVLQSGFHATREDGMCAMEFVAWVANEPHSMTPQCVDNVLSLFMAGVNDNLDGNERQLLRPYLGRCIGTAGDGVNRRAILGVFGIASFFAPYVVGRRLARQANGHWSPELVSVIEELLPTVELPWVADAIREKTGATS